MEESGKTAASIDEYIAAFEPRIREILERIRKTVREAAPEATEKISYQMPTFYLYGNLVHFAAFKNHIGFYPTPSAIGEFAAELSKYETATGSIRFPLDEPLPYDLVRRIVKYRIEENVRKEELRKAKKRSR